MTDVSPGVVPNALPSEMQDYSAHRRVKPLPKRRRTSDVDPAELAAAYAEAAAAYDASSDPTGGLSLDSSSPGVHPDFASYYQFASPADAVLDAQSGRIDDGNASLVVDPHGQPTGGVALAPLQQQHELFLAALHRGNNGGGEEEDDHADGDYIDHLQQPGNTKKRKVPAAHIGMMTGPSFDDSSGAFSGLENGLGQADEVQGFSGGQLGGGDTSFTHSMAVAVALRQQNSAAHPRKFNASPATMTGLKHKEMLKSRKRQVLAVVNSLPNAETLALDQALAFQLPWYRPASSIQSKTRRRSPRHRISTFSSRKSPKVSSSYDQPNISSWDDVPFSYECLSTTTDRLVATRAEVSNLVDSFQRELDRQAAAAAQAAREAAAANSEAMSKATSAKSQRMRTSDPRANNGHGQQGAPNGGVAAPVSVPDAAAAGLPQSKSRSKKKKRSALANASNPHHLRNYVPSRLPNSGPPPTISAAQAALQFLGPAPVRFLSADLAPRSGAGATALRKRTNTSGNLTSPNDGVVIPDEWICSFCEYDLFYGSEASFRHGMRQRKKILRRRRRARERAARAASGVAPAAASSQMDDGETEDEGDYEADAPYETAQTPGPRGQPGSTQQSMAGRMGGDDGAG